MNSIHTLHYSVKCSLDQLRNAKPSKSFWLWGDKKAEKKVQKLSDEVTTFCYPYIRWDETVVTLSTAIDIPAKGGAGPT